MNFELFNPQDNLPNTEKAFSLFPQLEEVYASLGNTPLISVPSPEGKASIFAKLESENPFGSVKDRVAFGLFCDAINKHDFSQGELKLLDASGGNMAKALAHLGYMCGIPVHAVIPDAVSEKLVEELKSVNAVITTVDYNFFLLGVLARGQEIAHDDSSWTLLSQQLNLVNVAVHQYQTGAEIRRQLNGAHADGWVAAVGTGGTLAGVSAALRQDNPQLKILASTPKELPYGSLAAPNGKKKFAGAGGFGWGLRQPFINKFMPEEPSFNQVSYEEAIIAMYEFFQLTGIKIGPSAAANWKTAWKLAETMTPDQKVVTLFADAGTDDEREQGREWFNQLKTSNT
ncbi:pyridoxal-phosphate dependent enzyme [Xenorhabdus szentirmaii]|uniref:cysteine synthase n=1 Tax=Xenorhabdus szentirmaii DSM 16338 TaxID=1427518 RepID=W1J0V3_9GAMM|nr:MULTISPECIES: pyridoxal-phosphate dependent enzyme [Xenorhabdus]MBD2805470.1 pyridoxal-phosphate dependent enzyme [Xenorhabdus sp. ZM]PHM35375.1 cysteine synthase [Xenorhabdus szentirmaii DSM 16338]PHM44179.1 cysteine synthase [Xenorhabdus szentirmaii]CDL83708.1 putative Cysteine synthase [Xenorhabdus szentirmaii DSM 16338]